MRHDGDRSALAAQFARFATTAAHDGAPLYQRICSGVAGDPALVALAAEAPGDQRRPNLLLAAVHYRLLGGEPDRLADHYPTVGEWLGRPAVTPEAWRDPFIEFRAFCLANREPLGQLVRTRATQTNEVGRCTALLPALATVAGQAGRPLGIVDLGASAGLNLLFDRYHYDYGAAGRAGDPGARVRLDCEVRGGQPPLTVAAVVHRAGIDRRPIDLDDPEGTRWLLACQWPDHRVRFRRLADAVLTARAEPERPRVQPGDMVDDLAAVVAAVPASAHLVVLHTWAATYLGAERQAELGRAVAALATGRPLSWLYAELPSEVAALGVPDAPGGGVRGATALVLVTLDGGRRHARRLADMHPHGRWLRWWSPG